MKRAYDELRSLGYITESTRIALNRRGYTAVDIERYINLREQENT